jgi:hypothetical protein
LSIKYTERLADAGIDPSVGTVGDSYDNLLKITIGHGITDVEKYGVDDHGFWIMCAFEVNGHEGFPACGSLQKLSQDRDSIKTTH